MQYCINLKHYIMKSTQSRIAMLVKFLKETGKTGPFTSTELFSLQTEAFKYLEEKLKETDFFEKENAIFEKWGVTDREDYRLQFQSWRGMPTKNYIECNKEIRELCKSYDLMNGIHYTDRQFTSCLTSQYKFHFTRELTDGKLPYIYKLK